jgi:peptidoglycan-associated lipoprotein
MVAKITTNKKGVKEVLMKKILIILMLGLLVFGCAPKKVTTAPDAKEKEAAAKAEVVTEAGVGAEEGVSAQDIARAGEEVIEGEGLKIPGVDDIHFDFDRYDIKPEAKAILMTLSNWLIKNNGNVLIEGHCDDRGTNEYNLALGDRRASSAKSYLVSTGVPASKIETISYGEEKPLCTEQSESCWWSNRRAHFIVAR